MPSVGVESSDVLAAASGRRSARLPRMVLAGQLQEQLIRHQRAIVPDACSRASSGISPAASHATEPAIRAVTEVETSAQRPSPLEST